MSTYHENATQSFANAVETVNVRTDEWGSDITIEEHLRFAEVAALLSISQALNAGKKPQPTIDSIKAYAPEVFIDGKRIGDNT